MVKPNRIVMDEETLIIAVQSFAELYDMSHPKYANNDWKDNCWKDVAKAMKQSVADCKAVWRRLREEYRKARGRRNVKSGAAASKKRSWKFEVQMAFLAPHLSERETQSNIDDPASTSPDDDNLPSDDQDEENEEGDDAEVMNERSSSPVVGDSSSPAAGASTSPAVGDSAENNVGIYGRRPNAKKSSSQRQNPPSEVASVFMKYLQDKPKKPVENQDPLTTFFINMAETVKTFTPSMQVKVKSKVFKLVNEYEMRGISNSHSDGQIQEPALPVSRIERESHPIEGFYRDEERPNSHYRYDFHSDYAYGGSSDGFTGSKNYTYPVSTRPTHKPTSNLKRWHTDQPEDETMHSSGHTLFSM